MFSRLRERARERTRDWALRYIESHPVSQEIATGAGKVVIHRYNVLDLGPLHVRIHDIVDSDTDPALHTHPWHNVTWVLDHGYWEIIPRRDGRTALSGAKMKCNPEPGDPFYTEAVLRAPGDVVFRGPRWAHRLKLRRDGGHALTLFVHWNWGRGRRWGMWSEIDGAFNLVQDSRR